jgi:hypothetical protein
MLLAHLVPGYFAATQSQKTWQPEWTHQQRVVLWLAALVSTFVPDLDVIYNALFRGFFNHSTLWTHSIFPHLGVMLCWYMLRLSKRQAYLQTLVGLIAIGGVSHLVLDVISHGTPLLYPISMHSFGSEIVPRRIIDGGVWAYITEPLFLLEPLFIALAIGHGLARQPINQRVKRLLTIGLFTGLTIFVGLFLAFLPILQASIQIR